MRITFCITTYNRLDFLKRCVASVLSLDFEKTIIISDNVSTDGTQDFCLELCREYNFVSYYRNKRNLGSIDNFISASEKVSTDYIVILADDDYLIPESFNDFYNEIKEKNYLFFAAKSFRLGSNNSKGASLPLRAHDTRFYNSIESIDFILNDLLFWSSCVFNTNIFRSAVEYLNLKSKKSVYREAIDVSVLYYLSNKYGFYYVDKPVTVFWNHLAQSSKPLSDIQFKSLYISRIYAFNLLKSKEVRRVKNIYTLSVVYKAKVLGLKTSKKYFQKNLNILSMPLKYTIKYFLVLYLSPYLLKKIFK